MASLPAKTFATLVSDMATAIQGKASVLVDLTVGSILRAFIEANAAVVLWLQGMILSLLALTRAATSSGSDLDSWVGDYGLTRLPAVAATGSVTFSRFTPTAQAVVLIGTVVQTADGTQKYTVTTDTTNAAYRSSLGGYVIASGTSSVTVPVVANAAGVGGNAAANLINTLTQTISGVDTVTNAAQFTNGANSETDVALRLRFVNYINSLAEATKKAIQNAVQSIAANITALVVENYTYIGSFQQGYFFVVVDDGSGNPPSATLTAASLAIDAVRPIGSTFGVYAPVIVYANIGMTIGVVSGYDPVATKAAVVTAVQGYVNTLALGATLPYSRLAQVAYDASPGVANVTVITLNSGTADLSVTNVQVIKAGTVTAS